MPLLQQIIPKESFYSEMINVLKSLQKLGTKKVSTLNATQNNCLARCLKGTFWEIRKKWGKKNHQKDLMGSKAAISS